MLVLTRAELTYLSNGSVEWSLLILKTLRNVEKASKVSNKLTKIGKKTMSTDE